MTFKEKLQMEHPWMNETITDVVIEELCPCDLGYEKRNRTCHHYRTDEECVRCWNREMQNTEQKTDSIPVIPQSEVEASQNGYIQGRSEGYNQGLNDAWELAHRLNNMTLDEIHRIYGFSIHREELFSAVDVDEALAKLKAYEEQSKIEVGDIFIDTNTGARCVLSKIVEQDEDRPYIVTYSDGSGGSRSKKAFLEDYKKTGRHIDIESILEQIRGE